MLSSAKLKRYEMIGEISEIGHQYTAEHMPGKKFNDVQKKMIADGYVATRRIQDRKSKKTTVTMTKGNHEDRSMFLITFNWDVGSCGVMVPGTIVSASWVPPLKPEPYEVK